MQSSIRNVDAVVVGAGFAGLDAVRRLRDRGLTVQGFEAAGGVGGTWYWNRYPGARTDSKSYIYCYTFSAEIRDEWKWSELFPTQQEVLAYLNFVADRLDLRPLFNFNTTVVSADWDDEGTHWIVRTHDGDVVAAKYLITAVGILSAPHRPQIEGIDTFAGQIVHTGRWPAEGVDVAGKRVAVIGSGSSGVQLLPIVAQQAEHLTLLQRTPNYVSQFNSPKFDDSDRQRIRDEHDTIQEQVRANPYAQAYTLAGVSAKEVTEAERRAVYEAAWSAGGLAMAMATFADLGIDEESNNTAAEFVRAKIHSAVKDPEMAALLTPDYPYGVKRVPTSEGYYDTFNRDNINVVDLRRTPIQRFTANGIVVGGEETAFDIVILATGFDAVTGALTRLGIRGRGGKALEEVWADGPWNYLGYAVPGFPNLFSMVGPTMPAGNVPTTVEINGDWIDRIIATAQQRGATTIEATIEAADAWRSEVLELNAPLLLAKEGARVNSWFIGANIEGKPISPLFYLGHANDYTARSTEERDKGFPNFTFSDR
ncbi:flavin-containing monooxygenase [Rhodococcus sp. T7]|uniref:flavin-containing monooxygenase n=1 Tax=Rhodococcus sp. T7 TaxID=627444 RepID=UPI00135B1A22|nr:NAD(P)/FAD-dependent oxidoreductase [Rhodococcus sp. T7]KAF0957993.1 Baeyer-Villiger monooxygenase [Rhodococcus sp. T7]KAF0960152.1 Baeyer-Villiger monooxygenase [Rhodococcus sp. T7]